MAERGIAYWSDYALGQKVFVGEDDLIVGRVTGIMLRSGDTQIEVAWMHNGALQCVWCSPLILRSAA